MEIYAYHPGTGVYMGIGAAQPNPLEPGRYLLPAHATFTAPPETGAHETAIWDKRQQTWSTVPDWRGVTLYRLTNGQSITEGDIPLGMVPAEMDATDVVPPDEHGGFHVWDADAGTWGEDTVARLAAARQSVKTEAERRIETGVVLLSDVRFRCDTDSMARITGMKDAPESLFPLSFKTAAGITVTITDQAEALTLFHAVSTHVATTLRTSAALQDGLSALSETALGGFDAADDQHWTQDQTIPPVS